MFRFTTRDLIWLTVLGAIGVAWWLDHRSTTMALAKSERLARELSVRQGELLQERTKLHNLAQEATREMEKATGKQMIWEYREE